MSDYDKKLIEMLREETRSIAWADIDDDPPKNSVCQAAADRIEELLAVLKRLEWQNALHDIDVISHAVYSDGRSVEWVRHPPEVDPVTCFVCGHCKCQGHGADCWLSALIEGSK